METNTLRLLVASKMREYYPNAKLWPNGLGFDTRGWQFTFREAEGKWYASKRVKGILALGKGENPFDAYAHAKPVKE
jgi:hypothetical protein